MEYMRSVWLATRAVVPFMTAGASIVNFSSLAARDGGGAGASCQCKYSAPLSMTSY